MKKEKREITEGNKFIAEFMELEITLNKDLNTWMWVSKHDGLHSLRYDSSWDWLMPVVKKILTMEYSEGIALIQGSLTQADIDLVWFAVIQFIKTQKP